MKRNKGFTLIELLAVIVILAIIALIAVPVVMNIINKANKSAFKDSAYGLIKAVELFYTDQLLENAGLYVDKTFTFPNDIEGLEIKGSKPTGGYVTVNKKGQVSMAITNGKYCVTKDFEDNDVKISDDNGNCGTTTEEETNVVYYNPNEAELCSKTEWNNNADKNGKSGCMRWYIYGEEDNKQKLILDHNTTNKVAWISADDYVDNDNCSFDACNDQGPLTLMNQLAEDTQNWKVEADIITIEEVVNLLPYYQNLSESDKQAFLNPVSNSHDPFDEYYDEIIAVNGNIKTMCNQNQLLCEESIEGYKARHEYFEENHSELILPKYMYEDILGTCRNSVDSENNPIVVWGTHGFWTKTALTYTDYWAWHTLDDTVDGIFAYVYHDLFGLRPVIKIDK